MQIRIEMEIEKMTKNMIEKIYKNADRVTQGIKYLYVCSPVTGQVKRIPKYLYNEGYECEQFWETIGRIRRSAQGLVFIGEVK